MAGASILTARIDFRIYKNNYAIFQESFFATDLLGDEAAVIPTDKRKEDTIVTRMKRFFEEDNFIHPAIKIIPLYDAEHSENKQVWEEINSDSTAIGFLYNYGYEGSYALAYSKSKAKVVCYYSSD